MREQMARSVAKEFFGAPKQLFRFTAAGIAVAFRIAGDEFSAAVLADDLPAQVLDADLQPTAAGWTLLHKVH